MSIMKLILCLLCFMSIPGIAEPKDYAAIKPAVGFDILQANPLSHSQNDDLDIRCSTVRSEKDELIARFAVSDSGYIACGYPDRTIEIYDESLVFLHEISFNYSASYAIMWEGDNLIVLIARIEKIIEIDPNGEVVRIESMNENREQENAFYNRMSHCNGRYEFRTNNYTYLMNRSDIFWSVERSVWITRKSLTEGSVETVLSSTKSDIPLILPAITFIAIISLVFYEIIIHTIKSPHPTASLR